MSGRVMRSVSMAVVFMGLAGPAAAMPGQAAIESRDVLALEAASHSAVAPDEAQLAAGAALSLRRKDDAALAILEPLSRTQGAVRSGACRALSDIYLRQGRYAAARDALKCAREGAPLSGEAAQVLDYASALAAEKPMRLSHVVSGSMAVRRDAAGLLRVRVTINGRQKSAVIDTDSSFCVLSESAAQRLGVRLLDKPVTIITSTRPDQPMRLGIADEMRFGDAVLTDVVFAVLPDKAVRFGPGYSMEAVIGLPVFVALGRIELTQEDGSERLYYGPRPGASAAGELNVIVSALDPFALVREKRTGTVLRLAIDSAADKTTLNVTALRDDPALAAGASHGRARWQGAGGDRTDSHALILPELALSIAGRTIGLKRVKLLSSDEGDRHGAIGQDILRQGRGWVLDFETMRFGVKE